MTEYIEREALLEAINNIGGSPLSEWDTMGIISLVANQPAVDVAPIVHGQWIKNKDDSGTDRYYGFHCSACNETIVVLPGVPSYCPWCGAKMSFCNRNIDLNNNMLRL